MANKLRGLSVGGPGALGYRLGDEQKRLVVRFGRRAADDRSNILPVAVLREVAIDRPANHRIVVSNQPEEIQEIGRAHV